MRELSDIVTIEELADRVGGRAKARALLRELDVPVVSGVFSQRLLLARLERREVVEDPVGRASAVLARHGLLTTAVSPGHPTVLTLAVKRALRIGQPEFAIGESSPFAPLVIRPGEHAEAVLAIASRRSTNRMAGFNVSRINDPEAPPLYVLYLAEEDRAWLLLRTEAEEFKRIVDAGERCPWFSKGQRKDGLRIALPKGLGDLDAAARVVRLDAPIGEG